MRNHFNKTARDVGRGRGGCGTDRASDKLVIRDGTEKTAACGVESPHAIILPADKKRRQPLLTLPAPQCVGS